MSKKSVWLRLNVEEIYKRTISLEYLKYGKIIVLRGKDKDKLSLVLCNNGKCKVIVDELIDYYELTSANTVEQRIRILLDAVRDFNYMFFIDEPVTKIIFKSLA